MVLTQTLPYTLRISTRPSPDVGHPYGQTFSQKMMVFGEFAANELAINIAVYRYEGCHFSNCVRHAEVTDVPSMPNFIAWSQMMKDSVIHVAMCVAEESDSHERNLRIDMRMAPSWRFFKTQ